MKFNYRIEDIEVRSCNDKLELQNKHNKAEIVQWFNKNNKESCITVAYWIRDSEGYNLQFVSNRPFGLDTDIFMALVREGQRHLDKYFNRK